VDIINTKRFVLRVHPAGLALMVVAAFMGHGEQALLTVAALLVHEGFHMAAILVLGTRAGRIELTPFGGVAEVESFQSLPASWQALIALSGVLGSLFCYFALGFAPAGGSRLQAFRQMNLMLGLFNLLPILPLDGARALGALADQLRWGRWIRKGMMGLAFGIALLMLGLAIYGAWHGHINITLIFAAPYLCYAARRAYVAQRLRLADERLRMGAKLGRDKMWKVDGVAIKNSVPKHELLKMLLALPGSRLHYFFLLNPVTGKVERVMEEGEVIEEIMGEGE